MRRIVLAFALAASASPAFAAQDRYGPPRSEPAFDARGTGALTGPMLGWKGKTAAADQQVERPAAVPERPEPIAPWAQRIAPRPAPAAQPSVQPTAATMPVMASAAAPTTRLVDAPPAQLRSAATPVNPPRMVGARAEAALAGGPGMAPARPAVASPPMATAQAPGAAARPRFYSVSRQYGAQPDPIPLAAPAPRGQALTLSEVPASENLGRTQAPLDDGRANQAVPTPVTKENAAASRFSRMGL